VIKIKIKKTVKFNVKIKKLGDSVPQIPHLFYPLFQPLTQNQGLDPKTLTRGRLWIK